MSMRRWRCDRREIGVRGNRSPGKHPGRWLLPLALVLPACSSDSAGAGGDTGETAPAEAKDSGTPKTGAVAATVDAPFNGLDLTGWQGNADLWSVENDEIVGRSDTPVARNEFLFLDQPVRDFYFSVEVKLVPDVRNSGIQFRSQRNTEGFAVGYQADIGKAVWGRLYHERGRGKLDWTDEGEKHVKPDDWNRVEILAVGHHIWTAINGHLSVSLNDAQGELEGLIAFQMHAGPPPDVRFRNLELVHDPEVTLAGLDEAALVAALRELPE